VRNRRATAHKIRLRKMIHCRRRSGRGGRRKPNEKKKRLGWIEGSIEAENRVRRESSLLYMAFSGVPYRIKMRIKRITTAEGEYIGPTKKKKGKTRCR